MTAPTPDLEALASRLHVAAIHLLRWLRREDDAAGLSAAQLSVISTLIRLGPSRIGDLARAERVTAPTMTRLVQRLERDGLVVRRAGKEDRRQSVVAVTHRAWMLLENGRKRRAEALRERLEDLSAAERRSLAGAVALLERIVDR
jgi:DNA-binding MarR family transcriptional regulator